MSVGLNRKGLNADKLVLIFWIGFVYLGALSSSIVKLAGGAGYLTVSYAFCVYFAVFFQSGGKESPKESFRRIMPYTLPFVLFVILYALQYQFVFKNAPVYEGAVSEILRFPVKTETWNMVTLLPVVVSAVFILLKCDEEMKQIVKYTILAILIAASFYAFVIVAIDPGAIRDTAAAESGSFVTYGTIYAMAVLVPALLYMATAARGKTKALYIVCALTFLLCIFVAEFTIAIFTAVLGILIFGFICIKNRALKLSVLGGAATFIVILLATGAYLDILQFFADIIPLETVKIRLEEFIKFFSTGETEGSGVRFVMYWNTFLMFLKHPVFGNIIRYPNGTDFFIMEEGAVAFYSGHSTNLDILSCCGIFVFALYAMFFLKIMRYVLKGKSKRARYTLIAVFLLFIFISTVNTVLSVVEIFPAVFLVAPCLLSGAEEKGRNGR